MKILLIAGGWSPEREVSLSGAKTLEKSFRSLGHEVSFFDLTSDFNQLLDKAAKHDFAFINLHGVPGEDGLVQAMLERVGCPYQGSGPAASFLALNKAAAKQIFRNAGLPTADWQFLSAMPDSDWQPALPYPLFVKSNSGGSSLNLGRADNREILFGALKNIFAHGDCALLEPEIQGREIQCAVLGQKALPPILIEPMAGDFFDYQSKYLPGGAHEICPAPLADDLLGQAEELALRAHFALGLSGYSRTDFILDSEDHFWILEINSLPGMTATSLVPQEAKAAGIDFESLLETLIALGLEAHGKSKP